MSLMRDLSSKTYPCPVCDYIFTLALSVVDGWIMWLCDVPWWLIVVIVHFQTAQWFLETRK
jgi:hypothetical protein